MFSLRSRRIVILVLMAMSSGYKCALLLTLNAFCWPLNCFYYHLELFRHTIRFHWRSSYVWSNYVWKKDKKNHSRFCLQVSNSSSELDYVCDAEEMTLNDFLRFAALQIALNYFITQCDTVTHADIECISWTWLGVYRCDGEEVTLTWPSVDLERVLRAVRRDAGSVPQLTC